MALTIGQLAVAIRATTDEGISSGVIFDDVSRMHAALVMLIDRYAMSAPEEIKDMALVQVAQYLYDVPPAQRRFSTSALRESGASSLLAPYRSQRLGFAAGDAPAAAGLINREAVIAIVREVVSSWALTGSMEDIPITHLGNVGGGGQGLDQGAVDDRIGALVWEWAQSGDNGAINTPGKLHGENVELNTGNFDGNLSSSDDDVQSLAQAVDDLATGSGGGLTQAQVDARVNALVPDDRKNVDPSSFTASDKGSFPVWDNTAGEWANGYFRDANGFTWEFDEATDNWILSSDKLNQSEVDARIAAHPSSPSGLNQAQVDARIRALSTNVDIAAISTFTSVDTDPGAGTNPGVVNLNLAFMVGTSNLTIGTVFQQSGDNAIQINVNNAPADLNVRMRGWKFKIGDNVFAVEDGVYSHGTPPNTGIFVWSSAPANTVKGVGGQNIFEILEPIGPENFVPEGSANDIGKALVRGQYGPQWAENLSVDLHIDRFFNGRTITFAAANLSITATSALQTLGNPGIDLDDNPNGEIHLQIEFRLASTADSQVTLPEGAQAVSGILFASRIAAGEEFTIRSGPLMRGSETLGTLGIIIAKDSQNRVAYKLRYTHQGSRQTAITFDAEVTASFTPSDAPSASGGSGTRTVVWESDSEQSASNEAAIRQALFDDDVKAFFIEMRRTRVFSTCEIPKPDWGMGLRTLYFPPTYLGNGLFNVFVSASSASVGGNLSRNNSIGGPQTRGWNSIKFGTVK